MHSTGVLGVPMETLEYKLLPAIDFFIEPDCVTGKRRELRCRRAMRGACLRALWIQTLGLLISGLKALPAYPFADHARRCPHRCHSGWNPKWRCRTSSKQLPICSQDL